ncbi:MAG: Tol-Pal system beta propeller repeat protein TolB [candidate division WOR-3 bacterium]
MKKIFRYFLVLLFLMLIFGWQKIKAQSEIWAKITAGATRQRIRLAIADFYTEVNTPQSLLDNILEIRNVIIDDLEFSLYFDVIRPDSTKKFSAIDKKIDYQGWQSTGAQVLLAADLQIKKRTNLTIRLYDLFTRKQIGSKNYELTDNYRALSHRIADEVIKILTGEDGINQTQIAFSLRKGNAKELAIVDYDGYNLKQLTDAGGLKLFPDWSHNGQKIAFCSYANNNLNIYTYDTKRATIDLIVDKYGLNTTPAYSPDGKLIAASLSFEGNSDIYLMNADGKNLRRLTFGNSIEISPTWSPSGQEIAFVSDRTGTPQIYIMNIDGTNVRRLTFEGAYNTSPAWSPRGDLIAYVSRVGGNHQIFVSDITGTNQVQLTHIRNNEEPSWSPDGLHIVFSSNRDGNNELYLMHWNGSGQRKITNTAGAFSPAWSPRLGR